MVLTVAFAYLVFTRKYPETPVPEEPRVKMRAEAGSVLNAADRKRVFAELDYWDENARYVFAEPEKIREPRSVALEVPGVTPPRIVMPLPDPGPLLRYSGFFKRLDGSPAPESRAVPPAATPGGQTEGEGQ